MEGLGKFFELSIRFRIINTIVTWLYFAPAQKQLSEDLTTHSGDLWVFHICTGIVQWVQSSMGWVLSNYDRIWLKITILTDLLHASCCLGANILWSSKQRNHTKGDFNPPQTSEEHVFERRLGCKIWSLACHVQNQTWSRTLIAFRIYWFEKVLYNRYIIAAE